MNKKGSAVLRLNARTWELLTAAGLVMSAATLFGFLGRFSWLLDLFSHFRVQYLVGLGLTGLIHLFSRRFKLAVLFLCMACVNLGLVLPLYFQRPGGKLSTSKPVRAMLLNVNTFLGNPQRVRQVIEEADPDILVLEEINTEWVQHLEWLIGTHRYYYFQPRPDNFGIGLYSRFPLVKGEVVYIGESQVPSIVVTVGTGEGRLGVLATHPLPPSGPAYSRWRNDQLEQLPDYIDGSIPVILLGDLNVTPWNFYYHRLLRRAGLLDSSQGRGIHPTWPSYIPFLLIPIDHCLHSPDVFVINKKIGAHVGSDHYPVIVDFVIKPEPVEANSPRGKQNK